MQKWRSESGADTILETLPKTSKYFTVLRDYWPGNFSSSCLQAILGTNVNNDSYLEKVTSTELTKKESQSS